MSEAEISDNRKCKERGAGKANVVLIQTLEMSRQRLMYAALGELLLLVLKVLKEIAKKEEEKKNSKWKQK